jgi:hypothetical protein
MAAASSPEVAVSKKSPRTTAEIIAFVGIEDPSAAVTRSTGRVRSQDNADATQLERAIRIAAKRYSITPQGTLKPSKLSFTCLSIEVIEERVLKLGVSLGSNCTEIATSIHILKQTKENHRVTYLSNNLDLELGTTHSRVLIDRAKSLCTDLVAEEGIDPLDNTDLDIPIATHKKTIKKSRKAAINGLAVRRSSRLNKSSKDKCKK